MVYSILCCDGGGYRGHLTALMLDELQKAINQRCNVLNLPLKNLYNCFDMFVGTSSGSLIVSALVTGKSIADIIGIFQNEGTRIFAETPKLNLLVKALTEPLFDGKELEDVLKTYLGQTTFGQIQKPIVITAYDCWNNKPIFFKNLDPTCQQIKLFDACRASSAYPGGFPAHFLRKNGDTQLFFQKLEQEDYFSYDFSCDGIPLIDGGLVANNPAITALADYIRFIKPKRPSNEDVIVASFGSGRLPYQINLEQGRDYSATSWTLQLGNPLLEQIYAGYSRSAEYISSQWIGANNYYRFQPVLMPDDIVNPLINQNNIVHITSRNADTFRISTFQANEEVNALFDKISHDYFHNNLPKIPINPLLKLEDLAAKLIV